MHFELLAKFEGKAAKKLECRKESRILEKQYFY